MAQFEGKPRLSIEPTPASRISLVVRYTLRFSEEDRRVPEGYVDSIAISDPFFPQSDLVNRKAIAIFNPADLDTELGGEEIYAQVHFRRNIDGLQSTIENSLIFPLAV